MVCASHASLHCLQSLTLDPELTGEARWQPQNRQEGRERQLVGGTDCWRADSKGGGGAGKQGRAARCIRPAGSCCSGTFTVLGVMPLREEVPVFIPSRLAGALRLRLAPVVNIWAVAPAGSNAGAGGLGAGAGHASVSTVHTPWCQQPRLCHHIATQRALGTPLTTAARRQWHRCCCGCESLH